MCKEYIIEKELLLLLSRVTFTEKEEKRIKEISEGNISWFEFFKYASKNKVIGLVWSNIKKFNIRHIPKYVKQNLDFIEKGQKQQNIEYLCEKETILNRMKDEGIVVMPVKGALLLELLYPDLSQRAMGDLDFLIKRSDEKKIIEIMKELGYIKGNYDSNKNIIIPVERKEDISWKLGATNLYPFLKTGKNGNINFYKIDFRHSVGEDINSKPIEEIVDSYIQTKKVNPAHIVAHLAAHLYHEATHEMSILYSKDINIIKFCDIREYCIKYLGAKEIEELVEFSNKYELENDIYYTFFYLREIYADGYETEVLRQISANKECIKYYYNDCGQLIRWKKDFFQRMFAADNFDELENIKFELNKSF